MRSCSCRILFGVLLLGFLWGAVCQAQPSDAGSEWQPFKSTSHILTIPGGLPQFWSYSLAAVDKTLGYDRPWQAKTQILDPDFSAAYALGGGLNVALNPMTRLTTSLQFLWGKIDASGLRNADSRSGLADLNIRAIHLTVGIQARF